MTAAGRPSVPRLHPKARLQHDDVRGRALDCGHYLPEEAPDETYTALRAFFAT